MLVTFDKMYKIRCRFAVTAVPPMVPPARAPARVSSPPTPAGTSSARGAARRAARRAVLPCRSHRATSQVRPSLRTEHILQLRTVDAPRQHRARAVAHPAAHRRRVAAAHARAAAAHARAAAAAAHARAAAAATTRRSPLPRAVLVEAAAARREPRWTAQVRRSFDQRTACGANHPTRWGKSFVARSPRTQAA